MNSRLLLTSRTRCSKSKTIFFTFSWIYNLRHFVSFSAWDLVPLGRFRQKSSRFRRDLCVSDWRAVEYASCFPSTLLFSTILFCSEVIDKQFVSPFNVFRLDGTRWLLFGNLISNRFFELIFFKLGIICYQRNSAVCPEIGSNCSAII